MNPARLLRATALAVALLLPTANAQAESLLSAFKFAYLNNPNIMSALLSVKAAAEDVALRKAGKRPSLSAGADYSANFGVANGNSTISDSVSVGLNFRQNLFDNYRTDSAIEIARAVVEVQMYALRNAEQNVLLSVANAYVSVVRDTQLVQLRQENVAFFDAQVSSADERLRIGEGTRIDVSQAEARRAQARRLLSRRDREPPDEPGELRALGRPCAAQPVAQLQLQRPSAAGRRFRDCAGRDEPSRDPHRACRDPRRAGRHRCGRSRVRPHPRSHRLALRPQLLRRGDTIGVSGSLRFTLSVPIYAGGALGASVRKANIQQIQSEVDALSTRDQVKEAVISAWAQLQQATAQITSAQSGVTAGQTVLEGLIQERDVGQRTTLDVLNAQAEVTSAREGLIQATTNRYIAAFSLIAATGRLSSGDLALGVGEHTDEAEIYAAKVEDTWAELRALD